MSPATNQHSSSEPGPAPEPAASSAEKGGRRRFLLRFCVLLISSASAIFLVEAWARTQHPFGIQYYAETNHYLNGSIQVLPEAARPDGRIFENRPATRLELARFEFCTDGAGLRAATANDTLPGQADTEPGLRLLFIGDSVTLGWGVDDADTWIRTLEREATAMDGRQLTCLNAGHLIYNTIQQADWLEAHGDALAPEVVVLTFVTNDVEDDHWALYQEIVSAQERIDAEATEPLGQKLVRLWAENLPGTRRLWLFTKERMGTRQRQGEPVAVEDMPGYAAGWERCSSALKRAKQKSVELGALFVVFDHTTPRIPAVRTWCEANDVAYFDFNFTESEWAEDVRVSLADTHANPLGNHYLFQKAWRALAETGHLVAAPPTESDSTPH